MKMPKGLQRDRDELRIKLLCCMILLILTVFSVVWLVKPLWEYCVSDSAAFIVLVYKILGLNQAPMADLASGKDIWHPLLYLGLLTVTGKLFGVELLWMRLVGVICLLADLFLMWKITRFMAAATAERRLLFFVTAILFLLIPYTLVGGVHIDIDTSVLPTVLLLFSYLFARFQARGALSARGLLLLSSILALAFWSKLTTPLAIPPALFFFYLAKRDLKHAILYPTVILVGGSILFLVTWYIFCAAFNLPFAPVLYRTFGIFLGSAGSTVSFDPRKYVRFLGIIVFWLNPLVVAAWIAATAAGFWDIVKGKAVHDTWLFLAILSAGVGFVYIFVGGVTFGVPKYHYPLCALISLLLAYRFCPFLVDLSVGRIGLMTLGALLLGAVYYRVGDPVYLLNYGLKMQALNAGSLYPVVKRLAWITLAYMMPAAVVSWMFFGSGRQKAVRLLLVLIAAQTIGFNFVKAQADYQVSYGYGYQGADLVYRQLPKAGSLYFAEWVMIPPRGSLVDYRLGEINRHLDLEGWKKFITEKKPDALVFGPALNTIEQMRALYLKPELGEFMKGDYDLIPCGDYNLYRKRKM